jgi:hypothetical protein
MRLMGKFCNNKESAAGMFTRFAYSFVSLFLLCYLKKAKRAKKTRIFLVGATSAPCFS